MLSQELPHGMDLLLLAFSTALAHYRRASGKWACGSAIPTASQSRRARKLAALPHAWAQSAPLRPTCGRATLSCVSCACGTAACMHASRMPASCTAARGTRADQVTRYGYKLHSCQ